jgi:NitT/TauT family transport system substrate-binding protein
MSIGPWTRRGATAAVIATALAAAGWTGSAAAATKVQLYSNPLADNLAAYVAKDRGFFEKRGLDVTITIVPNITATIAGLVSGSGQIAVVTPVNVVTAAEAGIPLVFVAGAQVLPTPSKRGLIVRADAGIKSPKDLVGKRIGTPGLYGQLHLALLQWMTEQGVDAKSLNLLDIPFAQLTEAFRAGQADAILTADPFYSRALQGGFGVPLGDVYTIFKPGTVISGFGALRPWIEANPDAVTAFRAALNDAIDYIHKPENKAAALETLQHYTKLPPAAMATVQMPNLKVEIPDDEMPFFQKIMKEQGFAKGTTDPKLLTWK